MPLVNGGNKILLGRSRLQEKHGPEYRRVTVGKISTYTVDDTHSSIGHNF